MATPRPGRLNLPLWCTTPAKAFAQHDESGAVASNLINTGTPNLLDLLSNGRTYTVPRFQREYSWEEEQWQDLWLDLLAMVRAPNERHYMGALVVQSRNDRDFLIIDGQQRLATLSLLALAVIERLGALADQNQDAVSNRDRAQQLRQIFVGRKDPASLVESSRLFLSHTDDGFYQNYLVQLREPRNPRGLPRSNRLLWDCLQYYRAQLRHSETMFSSGEKVARLMSEAAGRQLLFILITVSDELSAYTVFETLNARGVALSTTDLLKNYLFSKLRVPADLEALQRRWLSLIGTVQQERFPEFLRYHMLCRHRDVRSQRLFKLVRAEIKTGEDVFRLTDDLEQRGEVYAALLDPSHPYWLERPAARPFIRELALYRVRQAMPLLLTAWDTLSIEGFVATLRIVSILTFRYSIVCGLNPSALERIYHEAAQDLMNGRAHTAADVFARLSEVYVGDEKFERDFSLFELRNSGSGKKIIRYILAQLESDAAGMYCDIETDVASIEHVLPENPGPEWAASVPPTHWDRLVYRLGNLSLLESSLNRRVGNAAYTETVQAYSDSQYILTRQIAENFPDEWTLDSATARQARMSRRAVHIWRLDF